MKNPSPFAPKAGDAYSSSRGVRGKKNEVQDPANNNEFDWKLESGLIAKFFRVTIPAEDVERLTYIGRTNGRNQLDLNEVNLASMIKSIKRQQYYPAVGTLDDDGKYDLSDGGRRRRSAIYAERPLDVLYTKEQLTRADALALAKELQSGVEHSLRDLGAQVDDYIESQKEKDEPVDQKMAAKYFGVSETKISNALCAWRINKEWLEVFPVINDLSIKNFRALTKLEKKLTTAKKDVEEFIFHAATSFELDETLRDDEKLTKTFELLNEMFLELTSSKATKRVKPLPVALHKFKDKKIYATKTVTAAKVTLEFSSRLDSRVIDEIIALAQEKLKENYS